MQPLFPHRVLVDTTTQKNGNLSRVPCPPQATRLSTRKQTTQTPALVDNMIKAAASQPVQLNHLSSDTTREQGMLQQGYMHSGCTVPSNAESALKGPSLVACTLC
jgi:hypothetical protein